MKKLRKRALSLLLAAVMTASLLPTTAWAATEPARSEWVQGILDELNAPYTDPSDVKYQLLGPAPPGGL